MSRFRVACPHVIGSEISEVVELTEPALATARGAVLEYFQQQVSLP